MTGRWPANVILSPEMAEALDEQSGDRPSQGGAFPMPDGRNGMNVDTHEQADFDIQAPRIPWDLIPVKKLPMRAHTHKGNEPWVPKNAKNPKARRSNKYL